MTRYKHFTCRMINVFMFVMAFVWLTFLALKVGVLNSAKYDVMNTVLKNVILFIITPILSIINQF